MSAQACHWMNGLGQDVPGRGAFACLLSLDDPTIVLPPPVEQDFIYAPANLVLRHRHAARRAALRQIVGLWAGWDPADVAIGRDENGAPLVLSPQGPYVSIAHRGPLTALAVAGSAVGIDLEPVGEPLEPAWNILTHNEQDWLHALPLHEQHEAFLKIWTAKDSYVKALHLGLAREPREIEVVLQSGGGVLSDQGRAVRLAVAQHHEGLLAGQRVVACCAVLGP